MSVVPDTECKVCEEGELVYEYHQGYPRIRSWPDGGQFYVHRLTAVSEYGFESIKDKEMHHLNGWKFDGRSSNLVPLTHDEHLAVESVDDKNLHID